LALTEKLARVVMPRGFLLVRDFFVTARWLKFISF